MAPVESVNHDVVEKQMKDIIQDLYEMMVRINGYDAGGVSSQDVLIETIDNLITDLQKLHATAPDLKVNIPPEIIQYVDDSRNPDIYTREFVEMARRQNQLMKGKAEAFASFRDVLAESIVTAMPELKESALEVVDATGGSPRLIEERIEAAERERARAV